SVLLEIAIRKEGNRNRPYYARSSVLGSRDDAGVKDRVVYRLASVMSGLCLDVAGPSAGANVQQLGCNGLAPQDWLVTKRADGTATLKARHSGMCLTVAGGSAAPGANVEQQPCDSSAAQSWT